MKSKLHGSKKIAYVLVGAGAVALTGIAFSAWVITRDPVSGNVNQITVTVGDVEDHSIAILNAKAVEGYSALSFDAQSDDKTPPIVAGPDSNEQMEFRVQFDISGALISQSEFTSWYGGFKTTLSIVTNDTSASSSQINAAGNALNSAVNSSYLVLPISNTVTFSKGESCPTHTDDDNGSGLTASFEAVAASDSSSEYNLHVVLTYKFSWGSAFDSQNPGLTTASDESTLSSIKDALTSLKQASGAHLNVKLDPFLAA